MEKVQAKGQSSTPEPVIRVCTDFGEVRSNPANTEEQFQVRLTESKHCQVDFRGMYLVISLQLLIPVMLSFSIDSNSSGKRLIL